MQIGYIGLGKMGFNMVERLVEKGHQPVVFDLDKEVVKQMESKGVVVADSLSELISKLTAPRLVWVMVPYQTVESVLNELTPLLEKGDTVIDGGNSLYKESIRRSAELKIKGINFLDVGVSGGPSGARQGACLMVGGEEKIFEKYENLFKDLAVVDGYRYVGQSGAGHFVKMVHNGIEYGMMQAIAEGFSLLKASQFDLDLVKVSDLYNHSSVIESHLIGWLKDGLEKYGADLPEISGKISHSGEGFWSVKTAKELKVTTPVMENALNFRLASQEHPSYTGQLVSLLRKMFGGHER